MSILRWQLSSIARKPSFWTNAFGPVGVFWTVWQVWEKAKPTHPITAFVEKHIEWSLCLIVMGFVLSIRSVWPKAHFKMRLPNIDTVIEVRVGNIFSSTRPLVVTIPTTLECTFDRNIISRKSIHGQFITKYCGNDPAVLEEAILNASKNSTMEASEPNFFSKGNSVDRYEVGEVWALRNFKRLAYAATFASFNSNGKAHVNENDYAKFLSRLWSGIRSGGDSDSVDVALIGGTTARTHHRMLQDVFRDMVRSFSAASSEGLIVRNLTIYITPQDFLNGEFSPEFIERMLANVCDDHIGRTLTEPPTGTPALDN